MKLYGLGVAVDTARAMATLEEMAVDYHLITIDPEAGETKLPTYLSINPFGQIPALQDAHLTLFESPAIVRYIVSNYHSGGGPDLLQKSDAKVAALVNVWMEAVEGQQFNLAVYSIYYQMFVVPHFGAAPDQNIKNENVEKLGKVLDVYEARLSKSKYLAGDFISLADLHHIPFTFYLMATPHASLFTYRPHVKTWWEDISPRPACK